MAKAEPGVAARVVVLAIAAAFAWPQPAGAQQASPSGAAEFRLRGLPEPEAEDIFSDGGIEEANRATEIVPRPTPRPAPALAEEGQSRAFPVAPEPPVVPPDAVAGDTDPREGRRAAAVERGNARAPEEDPFAPQGLRLGSWTAFLTAGQSLGWTTNTAGAVGGQSGWISRSSAGVELVSDWARHEARVSANGEYQRALSGDANEQPALDAAAGLRLDLLDGVEANLGVNYAYSTEGAGSPGSIGGVAEQPGVQSFTGSAEIARFGGRLEASLRGVATRTLYQDAALVGGGVFDQSDRDNTLYLGGIRLGYVLSPAITPFVDFSAGRRIHDSRLDRNGDIRDASLYEIRGGAELDLAEKLSGEISAGWEVQDYDGALETLAAPSFEARLTWSPVRETQIAFVASTDLESSTSAGDNGSVVRRFGIEAERQANDRLTLRANAGLEIAAPGSGGDADLTWTAGAGLTYWLNRFLGFTADIGHERLDSGAGATDYDATAVTLGLTVRR